MRYYEGEGKTAEEAIKIVLEETQVKREEVKIEIIQEGTETKKARVRIFLEAPELDFIEKFLCTIVEHIGDNCTLAYSFKEPRIYINLKTNNIDSLLIGKRGKNLLALEYLLRQSFKRNFKNFKVHLDINNYRKKRIDFIIHKAKAISKVVKETGREMSLDPLDENEIRIVKNFMRNEKGVKTYTVRQGKDTIFVIAPV